MNYLLQCQCGALRGQLREPQVAHRGVCYCKDCRAYAAHLGVESQTHDAFGGAEFVATQATYVSFSEGARYLACLSLSGKGLLRWYATCCNTPVGNTPRNWRLPYVGLVHTCLRAEPGGFERSFPQLKMRLNTGSARHAPPGMALTTFGTLAAFIPRLVASSISGAYKPSPFFNSPGGDPVATVRVLSKSERERAYNAA
jgi:hypothetical protein